jgi:hypothetical protein
VVHQHEPDVGFARDLHFSAVAAAGSCSNGADARMRLDLLEVRQGLGPSSCRNGQDPVLLAAGRRLRPAIDVHGAVLALAQVLARRAIGNLLLVQDQCARWIAWNTQAIRLENPQVRAFYDSARAGAPGLSIAVRTAQVALTSLKIVYDRIQFGLRMPSDRPSRCEFARPGY